MEIDNADRFIVVCTDEGVYYLATRRVFETREAATAYAATVAESRSPLVIAGRWHQLRIEDVTRFHAGTPRHVRDRVRRERAEQLTRCLCMGCPHGVHYVAREEHAE